MNNTVEKDNAPFVPLEYWKSSRSVPHHVFAFMGSVAKALKGEIEYKIEQ
jgi:hypothetical protein